VIHLSERSGVISGVVISVGRRGMTAPLTFHFRTQLQNILKSPKIELRVFRVASVATKTGLIVFGGDFRSEMIFTREHLDDLLFVRRIEQPALRLNAGFKE
jgi:hypothetical protein